jgi:hypothetical protein
MPVMYACQWKSAGTAERGGGWRDVVNVNEKRFYSRFDLGSRRSPLSDELLTTLHNLGIPRLLVG